MRKSAILVLVLLALSSAVAWAMKISAFGNTDLYIERGKQIVIADFISFEGPHRGSGYNADVDVVKVLTGPTKLGKLRVSIMHPLARGTRCLLYSLAEPPEFQATPQLSVVRLPNEFDLSRLDGKSLKEQLLLIFEARQFEVEQELAKTRADQQLLEEQKLLDRALGKTDKPLSDNVGSNSSVVPLRK